MPVRRWSCALLVLLGCGRRAPSSTADDARAVAGAGAADAGAAARCERLAFPADLDLAEASGAVLATLEGRRWLVVVSDSGHHGAYALVDPDTGAIGERGRLPLAWPQPQRDHGSDPDDVEALAWRGGQLIGLSSAGWVRRWRRDGAGFALVGPPTPLLGVADAACADERVNCGRNYEGLCLGDGPADGATCIGMAAAKATGLLTCLVERADGRLAVDDTRALPFAPEVLSGCDLAGDGGLWLGANLFSGNAVWRITGWVTPARAIVTPMGSLGDSFAEAIAVGSDPTGAAPARPGAPAAVLLYRLGDHGGRPSRMAKFRCQPGPE